MYLVVVSLGRSMAMPREDNSHVNTREKALMMVASFSSFSTEAMASRRDVRTALSCLGLLIASRFDLRYHRSADNLSARRGGSRKELPS